jgi:hypothetical protein
MNVSPVPAGGTAMELAQHFAASINANACTDQALWATAVSVLGTVYLSVRVGGGNPPDLCIGSTGAPPDCCPSFAISTQCVFAGNTSAPGPAEGTDAAGRPLAHPFDAAMIEEIPTSGLDCNENGEDDTIDIVFGVSQDANLDGIPDECQATGVPEDKSGAGRAAFRLHQNSPNPFGARTRIEYDSPRAGTVRIQIFDVSGQLVRTLFDGTAGAGTRSVEWDGLCDDGKPAPAGVYLYTLDAGGARSSGRMSLVR